MSGGGEGIQELRGQFHASSNAAAPVAFSYTLMYFVYFNK